MGAAALAGPGARSALPSRGSPADPQLSPEGEGRARAACASRAAPALVQAKIMHVEMCNGSDSMDPVFSDHLSSVVLCLQGTFFVIYYNAFMLWSFASV